MADLSQHHTVMTSIAEFYAGRTLFITGATGFMGKVLLEKLLRSCPAVKKVYVLVRPKKGQDPQTRVNQILQSKLFEKIRETDITRLEKVIPVAGDILEPGFGISEDDLDPLLSEVSIVFHSAATVKFDEALKLSVQMNVEGVRRMIQLCKKMPNLEALVHVSTAYANCDKSEIQECVYPPPLHPKKLLDATEWMPDDVIDTLTPRLVKQRPNTYTYTKAMAEYLLAEEGEDLPAVIVRPSIVGASWQEPFSGWVDNFNGPTGLMAAIGKGLLNIMIGNPSYTADIVPVDLSANLLIAAAWYTALESPKNLMVYHGTTGQINRVTWGKIERAAYHGFMRNPLENCLRVPHPRFTSNRVWHDLNVWFDHYLPAWLLDIFMKIRGKKAMFVKLQQRIHRSVASLDFFTSNEWSFSNTNMYMLFNKLSEADQEEFNFDPKRIHWPTYMENYCLGTKRYALKEDMQRMPKLRISLSRLQKFNQLVNFIMALAAFRFLAKRVQMVRILWQFMMKTIQSMVSMIPGFARA